MATGSTKQNGPGFSKRVSAEDSLQARIDEVDKEIKAGKRKPKKGEFRYDTGEPMQRSWLRRLAHGLTMGLLAGIGKLISTVFRKVSDKLTGNTSQQDFETAKRTITALNEISDDETDRLFQINRERQKLEAERHLNESRLKEDRARAEANALMGNAVKLDKVSTEQNPGTTGNSGNSGFGLPHASNSNYDSSETKQKQSTSNKYGTGALLSLKEAYSEYVESKDLTPEQRLENIFMGFNESDPENWKESLIRAIHRVYCLHDNMLNGEGSLEGVNALTRVGVNQVMAYEAFISIIQDISDNEDSKEAMEHFMLSIREHGEIDNELTQKTLEFMQLTEGHRDSLYRAAASPSNSTDGMDWAWLVNACKKAEERLDTLAQDITNSTQSLSGPPHLAVQELSSPAFDHRVVSEAKAGMNKENQVMKPVYVESKVNDISKDWQEQNDSHSIQGPS